MWSKCKRLKFKSITVTVVFLYFKAFARGSQFQRQVVQKGELNTCDFALSNIHLCVILPVRSVTNHYFLPLAWNPEAGILPEIHIEKFDINMRPLINVKQ